MALWAQHFLPKPLLPIFKYGTLLLCILLSSNNLSAQDDYSIAYEPSVTRILFVLDGSGSMREEWKGRTKFEISKELLVNLIDSLDKSNPKVEVGIRLFGHQSNRDERNCKDTRLEVAFTTPNAKQAKTALDAISPQGWTPISYSLTKAADDFASAPNVKNVIILITDGLETCGGDPCAAGASLQNKRISLKPFIIGLGLDIKQSASFDCVGTYYDATDKMTFKQVLNTIVSKSLNPTTAQINLLDIAGDPKETDVEISMYDSYSGSLLYNFVHSLTESGVPDTLSLDPTGKYDLTVHTIPPVHKKSIELETGKHNIISVKSPRGGIKIFERATYRSTSNLQCLIRPAGKPDIVYVQQIGTEQQYLVGKYDIEILSIPRIKFKGVEVKSDEIKDLPIDQPGTLNILTPISGIMTVFRYKGMELERIYEFKQVKPKDYLKLQPGKYVLYYRMEGSPHSSLTGKTKFEINAGETTTLKY